MAIKEELKSVVPLTLLEKTTSENQFNWKAFGLTLVLFLGLTLLSFIPFWSFFGFCPNILSSLIYLWFLYRPDLLSTRLIITIGLFRDSLFAYPLGVSVIELLLLQAVTQTLRWLVVGHSFTVTYISFALFSISNQVLLWGLLSWTHGDWLPINGALKASQFNILIFPIVSMLSIQIQKTLDRRLNTLD